MTLLLVTQTLSGWVPAAASDVKPRGSWPNLGAVVDWAVRNYGDGIAVEAFNQTGQRSQVYPTHRSS